MKSRSKKSILCGLLRTWYTFFYSWTFRKVTVCLCSSSPIHPDCFTPSTKKKRCLFPSLYFPPRSCASTMPKPMPPPPGAGESRDEFVTAELLSRDNVAVRKILLSTVGFEFAHLGAVGPLRRPRPPSVGDCGLVEQVSLYAGCSDELIPGLARAWRWRHGFGHRRCARSRRKIEGRKKATFFFSLRE